MASLIIAQKAAVDRKFVQSRSVTTKSEGARDERAIVIHTMEAPEKGDTAESVANYFKNGAGGRTASVHFCVDSNSVVQTAQMKDLCAGAKGMNTHGIHIEHAGYAKQNVSDWGDEYSEQMLLNSAYLAATVICPKYGIPARRLTDTEIRRVKTDRDVRGFCGHGDVSRALAIPGGHTDPGGSFPWKTYLRWVQEIMDGKAISEAGDDVPKPSGIARLTIDGVVKPVEVRLLEGRAFVRVSELGAVMGFKVVYNSAEKLVELTIPKTV
jgi:N-acetyl-anhydromuramyl-L-alanine amidase AmpD